MTSARGTSAGSGSRSATAGRSSAAATCSVPDDYREFLNDGAPLWRAGANQSTQLTTELPLTFGGQAIPAGEYTVFIDLATEPWTFVVSTWPAQQEYNYENKEALFGAYYYTPDKDVVQGTYAARDGALRVRTSSPGSSST